MSSAPTGKIVTKITVGKTKATLLFKGGESIVLSLDAYSDMPAYVGKRLSEKQFAQLQKAAEIDAYFVKGLRYAFSSPKSAHEIYERIEREGAEEADIKLIMGRLKKLGLIDDESFAKNYAEDAGDLKLYGEERIRFELSQKGVSEAIIKKLSFPISNERKKADAYAKILDKKYQRVPRRNKKMKMLLSLKERGFRGEIASDAVEKNITYSDGEEAKELKKEYQKAKIHYQRKYDGYELKERILACLARKGFAYEDIIREWEENQYAD